MRFIHSSDWHLGRLFYGKHLTDDQAYVLEQFQAIVKDTKPDVILISGDIYDRAVPPTEAVELLDDTLSKILLDEKVPIIMIAGNHDSPERVGFGSKLLARQGLYVKGNLTADLSPIVLDDDYGSVYFMPFTYAEPALVRHVFQNFAIVDHEAALQLLVTESLKNIPQSARKVALAHTFIAGSAESESERPLSVGASSNVSSKVFEAFNYTALGHLHNAQRAGNENIRYSGSLMKYSFDEAKHKKGVQLVEIVGDGTVRSEALPLLPKYDVCKIEGYFDEILNDRGKYPIKDDYISVVLKDTQAILDVHGQLEKIYSNLMQIERPYLGIGGMLKKTKSDYRTKSETQLFADFFMQMTGEALSKAQQTVFNKSYEELLAKEREAKV